MDLYIFDIDGTITNTVDIDDNCFQQTFEELYSINRKKINWDLLKQKASGTDSGLFSSLTHTHTHTFAWQVICHFHFAKH